MGFGLEMNYNMTELALAPVFLISSPKGPHLLLLFPSLFGYPEDGPDETMPQPIRAFPAR